MTRLVLLRHGESQWNLENRFTGWTDVDLTVKGKEEAKNSGALLRETGYVFDEIHTSFLKRAKRTMKICINEMGLKDIPVQSSWRLNERHYGALQGLNKKDTAKKFGDEQVHLWRRSYDVSPPKLDIDDPRHPSKDDLYSQLSQDKLPSSECLKDTVNRFLPYWFDSIMPSINLKKRILIVAHGNSLRALVKYLDKISDEEIMKLNIPTGIPLVYELDKELNPINSFYLGNQDEVSRRMDEVFNQTKID